MSFSGSNATKAASNNLAGTSDLALNKAFPQETAAGNNLLNAGQGNVSSGTNFFNTLLNGNKANTQAMLQPNIDQIRQANANTISSASTLMPRGGGRSGTLFGAEYAPNQQIQNLFNTARTSAATALPQIGLGQQQIGSNLFNTANNALSAATGANSANAQLALANQQRSDNLISGIGSALFGLATTPFGSAGTSLLGRI